MSNKIIGLASACVCALVLLACAFVAGDRHRDNAWTAKQAKAERQAFEAYTAKVKQGEAAASSYLAASRAHTAQYRTLSEQFDALRKRTPLVVARVGQHVPGCTAAGSATASGPGKNAPDDSGPVGVDLLLTAGAVWMWNTALAGADQPASACSLADTSAAACAAPTQITLDDAWDNHAANAEICSANRLAHQQLIDFLKQRDPKTESGKP